MSWKRFDRGFLQVRRKFRVPRRLVAVMLICVALSVFVVLIASQPRERVDVYALGARLESLAERLNVLASVEESLQALSGTVSQLSLIVNNFAPQLTLITTTVNSLNAWSTNVNSVLLAAFTASWGNWTEFEDWLHDNFNHLAVFEAATSTWMSDVSERFWNSFRTVWGSWSTFQNWLDEQLENINSFAASVEAYVNTVVAIIRNVHGAVVPFHYGTIQQAVNAGEKRIVAVNVTEEYVGIPSGVDVEVHVIKSYPWFTGFGGSLKLTGDKSSLVNVNGTFNNLELRELKIGKLLPSAATLRVDSCRVYGSFWVTVNSRGWILNNHVSGPATAIVTVNYTFDGVLIQGNFFNCSLAISHFSSRRVHIADNYIYGLSYDVFGNDYYTDAAIINNAISYSSAITGNYVFTISNANLVRIEGNYVYAALLKGCIQLYNCYYVNVVGNNLREAKSGLYALYMSSCNSVVVDGNVFNGAITAVSCSNIVWGDNVNY